jgi:alkaline phosphatase D
MKAVDRIWDMGPGPASFKLAQKIDNLSQAQIPGHLCLLFFITSILFSFGCKQDITLQSGPMVGYSELTEVQVWVQSIAKANMSMRYWEVENPEVVWTSPTVVTKEDEAFTAKLLATELEPGKTYGYSIWQNGRQVELNYPTQFQSQSLWQYRTDPPDFRLALGSCTYVNEPEYDRPGEGYGGDYRVFESLAKTNSALMLWLGDNTYYREVDFFSWKGLLHRNTHTRSIPEMQALLGSTHHYAIWDDHDYGPNDAVGSWFHKDRTKRVFELFWANNGFGNSELPGITSTFFWNDCQFFLLDNRWNRTPKYDSADRQILGKKQIDWLISGMKRSRSSVKFVAVGGQVVNTAAVFENFANYPEERDYLLRRISEEGIRNVVFLTGDRHHSELSAIELPSGEMVYDFTVSPLTSGVSNVVDKEVNENRVEGSLVQSRGYGLIDISGPLWKRTLHFQLYDADGGLLWEYKVEPSEKEAS